MNKEKTVLDYFTQEGEVKKLFYAAKKIKNYVYNQYKFSII